MGVFSEIDGHEQGDGEGDEDGECRTPEGAGKEGQESELAFHRSPVALREKVPQMILAQYRFRLDKQSHCHDDYQENGGDGQEKHHLSCYLILCYSIIHIRILLCGGLQIPR